MRNNILKRICFYSNYIITYAFLGYLSVYTVLKLYDKSVIYNYIVILLLGLYLGYRFADFADQYLRKHK